MKAQSRIKHQADKHRSERVLEVGDMVYLKIQPYKHTSLSLHNSLKLHSKFYGPFKIFGESGKYSLQAPFARPLSTSPSVSCEPVEETYWS